MKAKDIVAQEVARQAKFGMEPGWEDFAIAGKEAGISEVVEWLREYAIYGGKIELGIVLRDMEAHSPFLKER